MWLMGKLRVSFVPASHLLRAFALKHLIPCKTVPRPYIYPLFDASGPVRALATFVRRNKMNTTSLAFANGEDMAELASTMLVGRESMYVAVFKGTWLSMPLHLLPQVKGTWTEACHGVLSQEAHLFSNEEKDYLTRTLDLPCKFVQ
jgi:hypothetical protein